MSRLFVLLVVIVMLISNSNIEASVSGLVNGSFEDDSWIDDITVEEPNGWDVNMPGNFGGWVYSDWVTDGFYNLTVFSDPYTSFEANDIATVYQYVVLGDVNQIVFDISLDTQSGSKIWDPNLRTAVVMIDDEVVWESNSLGPDVRDEYFDQVIDISNEDYHEHKLSIALRCDVNEATTSIKYYTDWDYIRFDLYCDGNGFLLGDFNRDCYVDEADLESFAQVWPQMLEPASRYNLYNKNDIEPYGIINFRDFALFALSWDVNLPDLEGFVQVWFEEVPIDEKWNLYKADDTEKLGIIDFLDFAVFSEEWLKSSYD